MKIIQTFTSGVQTPESILCSSGAYSPAEVSTTYHHIAFISLFAKSVQTQSYIIQKHK